MRYYAKVLHGQPARPLLSKTSLGASEIPRHEAIARFKPDGYTIGINGHRRRLLRLPALFKKVLYDPVNDFDQVATLMRVPWFPCSCHPKALTSRLPSLL